MPTTLHLEPYLTQKALWPTSGKHILAQYDDASIVVYQAYRPEIGTFAAEHQYFGGPFKLDRMTWIKPNFLWMMYRSNWGRSEGQEVVLAIRLRREAFDHLLSVAVHSKYRPYYGTRQAWKKAVASSDVRLQWDPDHDPTGTKLERRAIQLGLRGETVKKYARPWILSIEDISAFVAQQRAAASDALLTPRERVYPIVEAVAERLLA